MCGQKRDVENVHVAGENQQEWSEWIVLPVPAIAPSDLTLAVGMVCSRGGLVNRGRGRVLINEREIAVQVAFDIYIVY